MEKNLSRYISKLSFHNYVRGTCHSHSKLPPAMLFLTLVCLPFFKRRPSPSLDLPRTPNDASKSVKTWYALRDQNCILGCVPSQVWWFDSFFAQMISFHINELETYGMSHTCFFGPLLSVGGFSRKAVQAVLLKRYLRKVNSWLLMTWLFASPFEPSLASTQWTSIEEYEAEVASQLGMEGQRYA